MMKPTARRTRERSVTLDQIDEALTDWHGRLRTAGNNLMALSQEDAYRRLRGEGGWPKAVIAGVTAARVAPAIEALQELWAHFARLAELIDRADALRQGVSRLFPSRQLLDEIAALLQGPSIQLPPLTTPLARRGLLGPAETERAITPDDLLAAMTRCFESARDVVLAVGSAWDRVPLALDRLDAEAAALLAEQLPANLADELTRVRQEIVEVRPTADADPLGADERLAHLSQRVATVRGRLAEDAREREQLRTAVADARALLERVKATADEAARAMVEQSQKVEMDSPAVAPPGAEEVAALGPWLDRLNAVREAGRFGAARIGLGRWTEAAGRLLRQAEESRDAARAALDRRRDLRGLLGALRAKAAALGRAEEAALGAIARQAEELLRRRPTPLAAAGRVVAEYQRRLI
jgi:hypothetical protein